MSSESTLTEIGLLFTDEGGEHVLDLLAQLEGATAKLIQTDDERLAAEAKLAAATERLSQSIQTASLGYVESKASVLEFKAAQIGATEAVAEQIELLRQLEAAHKAEKQAIKDKSDAEKEARGLVLDQAEDYKNIAKQETKDKEEAAKLQRGLLLDQARDYQYLHDEREKIKTKATKQELGLEQDLAKDIQHLLAQEAKLRKGLEDDITKDIQYRIKFEADAAAKIAKDKEQAVLDAKKAADDAVKIAEQQAMEEIAWANKTLAAKIKILQELEQYQARGIRQTTIADKFGAGALGDQHNLPAYIELAKTNEELKKMAGHHATATATGRTFAEMWNDVSFNTSRARSEMIVLAHEIVQGRFSRIPASMMVFAEYTDLAALATTGLGAAVIATTLAVAALGYFMIKGSIEHDKFNHALIDTGNYAGMSVSQLHDFGTELGKTSGTVGNAREALLHLAASGRFTKSEIETIAPAVVNMGQAGGEAVDKLIGDFKKLAKDPVKASKALNEQHHYLTLEIYEQISAMDRQGEKRAAAEVAEKEFAKASNERADEIKAHLGWFQRGWNAVTAAVSGAVDAAKSMGAQLADSAELAKLVQDRNALEAGGSVGTGMGLKDQERLDAVTVLNDKILSLQVKMMNDEEKLAKDSKTKQYNEEGIAAQAEADIQTKRKWTNAQKRADGEAKIYREDMARNRAALNAQGIDVSRIEDEQDRRKLAKNATPEQVRARQKAIYDVMLAVAKEGGAQLFVTEKETQDRLNNVDLKHHDEAVKEIDHTEVNKANEANNKAAEKERQQEAILIQGMERAFQTKKRLATDTLQVARADAAATEGTHTTNVAEYQRYVNNIKDAEKQRDLDEKAALARKVLFNDAMQDQNIKNWEAEKTNSERGKQLKAAGIAAAIASKQALLDANMLKRDEIDRRGGAAGEEAESTAYKLMTEEMDRAIVSAQKLVKENEKHYRAVGMTKTAVRELEEAERAKNLASYEAELLAAQMGLDNATLTQDDIKLQQQKIEKLEKLVDVYKKLIGSEEALKRQQADTKKGVDAGLTEYLNSVENTYKTAEKVTVKAFKGMEDALTAFVMTGKLSFKSLANSIIADLVRMAIQQNITGPLATWGKSLFSVAPALWSGAAAGGGDVQAGKNYEVNENGPELLNINGKQILMMGNNSGNVTPTGSVAQALGSGGGDGQVIHISINQTVGDVATVSMLQKSNTALIQQIKGALTRSQNYGGSFAQ